MGPRCLAIALLAWSGTALAEDLIVIESNAPGLANGTVVADGNAIEVPAGAKVVLVGMSGKTVPLSGPYKGVPSAGSGKSDSRLTAVVASLLQPRQEETGSVGAVRAIDWRKDHVKTAGDVMLLDAGQSGTQCAADAKQAALTRNPAAAADKVVLMSADNGATETLSWPIGKPSLAWPAGVPLEDGNTYLVELPPQSAVTQFTVKLLNKPAANDVERAVQLSEAGCKAQALLMLSVVAKGAK